MHFGRSDFFHRRLQHIGLLNISERSYSSANRMNKKIAFEQHQKSLPRLPIASLEHLATHYLKSIEPLCQNNHDYEISKKNLESFVRDQGQDLQKRLQNYSLKQEVYKPLRIKSLPF